MSSEVLERHARIADSEHTSFRIHARLLPLYLQTVQEDEQSIIPENIKNGHRSTELNRRQQNIENLEFSMRVVLDHVFSKESEEALKVKDHIEELALGITEVNNENLQILVDLLSNFGVDNLVDEEMAGV